MDKNIKRQCDIKPQDHPNSDCTVILPNHPESNSERSTILDESCLSQRKRILLSYHKQILAKVREQRLVSKNQCEMFNQKSPMLIPINEQFQNDSDCCPLIVSVRPISQTASGSMKLSYTIKEGLLSRSFQEARRSVEILEDGTSIPSGTNLQKAEPLCLEQIKITQYPKEVTSIPSGTSLQEAEPIYLEQRKITQYPKDDTSIPAGTNLEEAGTECLGQTRIPGFLEDDLSIPAGTILPEIWAERLGQMGIPLYLHGDQNVPAETVLELTGVEYPEEVNIPDSFQADPKGLGRAVGEIQNSSSNLEWVRSLGPEHAITVLYTSPSVDNGISDKHDNEVIEEQYLPPVKKRKVKK